MMAERVWAPMLAPDSRACGNCHSFKVMALLTATGYKVTLMGRDAMVSPL